MHLKKLNNRGNAAMEFALVLPLMLAMFFGMIVIVNYIMVSRKFDSAANDISAIIAREGRIATKKQLNAQNHVEFIGGQAFLQAEIDLLVPILTYPLNVTNYNYDVTMVGKPLWSKIPSPIAPGTMRQMWQSWRQQDSSFNYSISGSNDVLVSRSDSGTSLGVVASITQDGESQIIAGLTALYDQGGNQFLSFFGGVEKIGMNFANIVLPDDYKFAKVGAYPVRVFPAISANKFNIPYNDLNICTDCNLKSEGMSGNSSRQKCTAVDPFGFTLNVSGCVFD